MMVGPVFPFHFPKVSNILCLFTILCYLHLSKLVFLAVSDVTDITEGDTDVDCEFKGPTNFSTNDLYAQYVKENISVGMQVR